MYNAQGIISYHLFKVEFLSGNNQIDYFFFGGFFIMTTSLSPDKMSLPSSVHNRHRVNAFPSSKRYVIILYGKDNCPISLRALLVKWSSRFNSVSLFQFFFKKKLISDQPKIVDSCSKSIHLSALQSFRCSQMFDSNGSIMSVSKYRLKYQQIIGSLFIALRTCNGISVAELEAEYQLSSKVNT